MDAFSFLAVLLEFVFVPVGPSACEFAAAVCAGLSFAAFCAQILREKGSLYMLVRQQRSLHALHMLQHGHVIEQKFNHICIT